MAALKRFASLGLALLLLPAVVTSDANAETGDPLSMQLKDDGTAVIENFWGLGIHVGAKDSETKTIKSVDFVSPHKHAWQRPALADSAKWVPVSDREADSNELVVTSQASDVIVIEADGVTCVVVSPTVSEISIADDSEQVRAVVILGDRSADEVAALTKSIEETELVVWSAGSEVPKRFNAKSIEHNCVALSSTFPSGDAPVHLMVEKRSYELSETLESLFTKMERANRDSQRVFEKLSPQQLNFQPSNGTHTPRWNAEHMMGRQLGFFSQIYHAQDETIPVMNLNPKQMPKDYTPAYPTWDGHEEARRMERVGVFCRKFAYLLDGVPLDARAPGSRWTLRGLLMQMERHYDQHTANTVAKFDLSDYPAK